MEKNPIYQATGAAENPLFTKIRYVRGPATATYHLIGAIAIGDVYEVTPDVAEAALATGQFEQAD